MKSYHQYDQCGSHRLGVSEKMKGDLTRDAEIKWGKWVSYTTPAVIKRNKTTLVCCSDYYTGSTEFPKKDHMYLIKDSGYEATEVSQIVREVS